jgi:hypothetical protein
MEESSLDTRKAIICFQYVERIKSELIIAVKLLEKLDELEGDELAGAEKMMVAFLDALAGEITIAHGVLGMQNFDEARKKILDTTGKILSQDYVGAMNNISKAISSVTTSGSRAMQKLKENNLL